MIIWLILLILVQPALSSPEPYLDHVQTAMRHKLDLLTLNDQGRNVHSVYEKQYDIMLKRLNYVFNYTMNQPRSLLSRSRNSGRFYLLVGNEIHRMIFNQMCFRWSFIATIEDSSDSVGEFEIEEIISPENKTFLIVALYLEDRIQIYQIPGEKIENNNTTIKSIQKIRRPGTTTKTFILHHSSNVYLITGYMDSDSGKVAVYRWLNFHFSVEDVKDVSRHTELIVHSNKQLVILVLDSTEHSDRSTNHIYVLNEQRKLVKTQEMYFLFNRMPHYVVDEDLYILRCLALDKCFLYKWNGENLFLRVSKVGLNPGNIESIDSNDSIIALSFKNELFFYRNQPLLKMASAYAVTDEHGTPIANHINLDSTARKFVLYKEAQSGLFFIFLVGNENENILEILQLQLSLQQRVSPHEGEQDNFNVLKTSLMNIKTIVNIRKGWIDLMKYQMTKIVRACKTQSRSSLSTNTVFIAESNTLKRMSIHGVLEGQTSLSVLHKWKSVKSTTSQLYARSKDLFYLNKANAVQTNMKVRGNLHTKNIEMKSITIQPNVSRPRSKRKVQSVRSLTATTINAKDILYLGTSLKGLVYKNGINRFPFPVNCKNIHAQKINAKMNAINTLHISNTLYNTSDSMLKGMKLFKSIESISGDILQISSDKGHFKMSVLRNVLASTESESEIRLSGTRDVNNLIISEHLNRVHLKDLLNHLYPTDTGSIVKGNVYVKGVSQIRNIHSDLLNKIETQNIFNLRTNQTIVANIYMHKVYAKALYNNHMNGLSIPKDVTLIGDTQLIKTALASNFVILHDLTLSSDERSNNHPILGTHIEDFSHIYLGNVYLKGSLTLASTVFGNLNTQILINDQLANAAIGNHFWMKHLEQNLMAFAFHRHVGVIQMFCQTLNYQTVVSYMRLHQWSLYSQNFSKVHVHGKVELFTTLFGIAHHINSEAIRRDTMSTVQGKKIFDGLMQIDFLAVEFVGFNNIRNLITEQASAFTLNEFKQINRLNVHDCIVSSHKETNISQNQRTILSSTIDCSLNIRDVQKLDRLFISDLEVDQMNTTQINGRLSEQFILEVNDITSRVEPTTKDLKIENLISKVNVISTNQMIIENINQINLADYFGLLALKGRSSMKHREIGGCKNLIKSVTIDENFITQNINDQNMNHLINNAARKSVPQNIVGLWFTNYADLKYLTTKEINGLPMKYLLNVNLRGFKLRQNLMLEALTIQSNINGHIVPNVSSITIPSSVQYINSIAISGSFFMQKPLSGTNLFDVLLASVSNERNTVEGKIVFHCESLDWVIVWNDGKIIDQNTNFQQIIMDVVTKKQELLVFYRGRRDLKNLVCHKTAVINGALTVNKINDRDIFKLNSSIHTTGHQQEAIGSVKRFIYSPNIVEFTCPDQLNGFVYSHHLTQKTANQNKVKYRFANSLNILRDLQANTINGYSIQHFMSDCVLKNKTTYNEYLDNSQLVSHFLTFTTLDLSLIENVLQTINQIPLNDVMTEVSNEHQMMPDSKQFEQLTLLGPASVIQCNEHVLLDNFKLSYWLHDPNLVHESVSFNSSGILRSGIIIDNALNNVLITTFLRFSSVEDLLPILPRIRTQLLLSRNAYKSDQALRTTPYFENVVNYNRSLTLPNYASVNVDFKQTCIQRIDHINITVDSDSFKSASTLVPGTLIRSDYAVFMHNSKIHVVILTLVKIDAQMLLSTLIFLENQILYSQNLASSPSVNFKFIKPSSASDTHPSFILAVSETIQVQSGSSLARQKLYLFDEKSMKFTNFKTLTGEFNIVDAVKVDQNVMLLIVEEGSNVLTIMSLEKTVNVMYQKVIFNDKIVVVETIEIQGVPAIRVVTNDELQYLYVHSSLVGWKQSSYGKIPSSKNRSKVKPSST